MRRNLTISFDERFIIQMDEMRGKSSRGVWIEAQAEYLPAVLTPREQAQQDLEDRSKRPPTSKPARSPMLQPESEPPAESVASDEWPPPEPPL